MSEENIPLAPRAPASTVTPPVPSPVPQPAGNGWWSIDTKHDGHQGLKEEVAAEIERDVKIPTEWKLAIIEQVKLCPGRAVEVHAVCTPEKGDFHLNIHIKRLF